MTPSSLLLILCIFFAICSSVVMESGGDSFKKIYKKKLTAGRSPIRPKKENSKFRKQNQKSSLPSSFEPLTCVVGAGLSGLAIAHHLQKKGHQVYIFDRRPEPGGKIVTVRQGHTVQVEMSPLFFGHWDDCLMEKIEEFDLTPIPFNGSDLMEFNPKSGRITSPKMMTDDENEEEDQDDEEDEVMMEAMDRYMEIRSQFAHELDNDFGYTNLPPELCISTAQWLEDNDLDILKKNFRQILTLQGYGSLDDLSAFYALKFLSSDHLSSMGKNYFYLNEGLDVLALKMAEKLEHLFLRHEVLKIVRHAPPSGGVQVTSLNLADQLLMTVNCHEVILAFPPLLQNLEKIIVDLTPEERGVLDHVKIHKVATGAHHIPSFRHAEYVAMEAKTRKRKGANEGSGQVLRFVRQSSRGQKNIYSSLSWIRGDFRSTLSPLEDAHIERQCTATLVKMGKDFRRQGPSTTFFREMAPFFPHVTSRSLGQGFYEQFEEIQGNGGLYFATTLLTFESMDGALRMGQEFVKMYF